MLVQNDYYPVAYTGLNQLGDGVAPIIGDVFGWLLIKKSELKHKLELTYASEVDEPYSLQYGFQDPATTFFEKLIDFHHDMLFLMIVVLVFVFYMLMACIYNFNQWNGSLPACDIRYNAKIETIWTVVPTLILLTVVVPAFSLIYSMDDTSSQPLFSVKIAGNQWFWTYEYVFLKLQHVKSSTSSSSSSGVSKPSFVYPYVVPADSNRPTCFITPQGWTAESSQEWHYSNNDFNLPLHYLQATLKPITSAEEWFDVHVALFKIRSLQQNGVISMDKYYSNGKTTTLACQLLATFLTKVDWSSKEAAALALQRLDEFKSFVGKSKTNVDLAILRLFSNEELFYSSKGSKPNSGSSPATKSDTGVFKLKAYSFDSTMLPEDEVLKSCGVKARLLSVDKPLFLPVRTLLTVAVTAYDVIHSWTVPSFGVKLDGCPGRSNTVSFAVKRPGIYYGQCSEICGVNHAFMPIEVRVLALKDFINHIAKWK